jgi:hypothetical protein
MPFQINVVSFGIHEGAENIGNQDVSPQSCMLPMDVGCSCNRRGGVLDTKASQGTAIGGGMDHSWAHINLVFLENAPNTFLPLRHGFQVYRV